MTRYGVYASVSTIALPRQAPRPSTPHRQNSFFFFSSRRRHTRFDCDWSSDVCSSDLKIKFVVLIAVALLIACSACRRLPPTATNPTTANGFGWELDNGQRAQISDYKGDRKSVV